MAARFDLAQLEALSAAVAEGTFDAAARVLHVTPSAVSQRIRALETATGRVLLIRSRPVRPTPSGEAVLRLARQVDRLAEDAALELGAAEGPAALAVAVNADSLASWFLPAIAPLAGELSFHLVREDEARTSDLLRAGTVVAAVTADAEPVVGCTVTALGAMVYRPVAARAFVDRWLPEGATAAELRGAPVVVFDGSDRLQHEWLAAELGEEGRPPMHLVPSTAEFARAVRLGFGWGALTAAQLAEARDAGEELVELRPGTVIEVPLFWQHWRLRTPSLDRLTEAVVGAARTALSV